MFTFICSNYKWKLQIVDRAVLDKRWKSKNARKKETATTNHFKRIHQAVEKVFCKNHLALYFLCFQQVYQHLKSSNISDSQLACLLLKIEIPHGAQSYYSSGLISTLNIEKHQNLNQVSCAQINHCTYRPLATLYECARLLKLIDFDHYSLDKGHN